jgi:uncharacterized protein YjbJ (UPF0337 family)
MGELTDKVKGTAKEATGKVTGDDSMRREGKIDQFSGDVKGKGNDLRDKASDKVDDLRDKLHHDDDKV